MGLSCGFALGVLGGRAASRTIQQLIHGRKGGVGEGTSGRWTVISRKKGDIGGPLRRRARRGWEDGVREKAARGEEKAGWKWSRSTGHDIDISAIN